MGIEVVNYQNRARLDETVFDSMDITGQDFYMQMVIFLKQVIDLN